MHPGVGLRNPKPYIRGAPSAARSVRPAMREETPPLAGSRISVAPAAERQKGTCGTRV